MKLNILATQIISGIELSYGTNEESEKFSLFFQFPTWKIEVTEGKGSKKKVVGFTPATFSKRSVSEVMEWTDSAIPEKFFIRAVDESLPGLRLFLGKNNIQEIGKVKEFVSLVSEKLVELTPVSGSVADPLLEAKRIFSRSDKYENLNYEDSQAVMETWKQNELARISRIMEKASMISSEEFREFCTGKYLANGVDPETGIVRLKGKKDSTEESDPGKSE